jgi:uncharacterized protein (DUF885 family)
MTSRFALSVCLALLTSCALEPPQSSGARSGTAAAGAASSAQVAQAAPANTVDSRLVALVEEYFEEQLKLFPTLGTYIGDERYNDQLEQTTDPAFWQRVRAAEQSYLERARALDPQLLSPSARVTLDIFVSERELALEGFEFPDYLMPLDQLNSMASTLAVFGSGVGSQPFRDAADYDKFLRRLQAFPAWADGAIAMMRDGLNRGVTLPRPAISKVVPQLREIVVGKPQDSIFWQAIKAMPESIAETERARLTTAYRTTIAQQILPAYARLADFIEKDYVPNARTSVGWSAQPNGQAWYRYRIRTQTTTRLTAEEIHSLGLGEVARIRAEMTAVKERVAFKGDLEAFFEHLQTDSQFYFKNDAELLAGYRDIKRRVDALLPKMFNDFPKADYEVRAVEPFRAASSAGAFYQGPSADGKRPGIFYVNTYNLKAQPIFGMETLSLHEAAPGHHFQVAIQQELTDLPRFRRFNNYTAYAEGWALYCESIGKELGMFVDPYQWYGRLSDEMLRAMRLVVDTGLHSKGWSREQAIQFMQDNSSMADSDVVAEVERYIVWPGQALGYKVGQLRMSAMRARAEQQLGAAFDVRQFHSQLLRDGAVPLDVLEAKIDRWIAAQTPQSR